MDTIQSLNKQSPLKHLDVNRVGLIRRRSDTKLYHLGILCSALQIKATRRIIEFVSYCELLVAYGCAAEI